MKKLFWVWYDNRWCLAFKCDYDKNKYQIVELDTSRPEAWGSSIIIGPNAGMIEPPPKNLPEWAPPPAVQKGDPLEGLPGVELKPLTSDGRDGG